MNQDKTIILACSSLTEYVEAAQASVGTKMRVRYLNRIYHRDPAEMQEHIKAELERMPEGIDTVLVCMGFCGGSWNQVQSRYRLVIPRVDDCVSLLLQTKDDPVSNLKTPGHLYVRAMDPSTESFKAIFERLVKAYNVDGETVLLFSTLGFWHSVHVKLMPHSRFLIQHDRDTFSELVNTTMLPSFMTNLSVKYFGKNNDRGLVPLLNPEASVTFHFLCLKENYKKLKPFFRQLPKGE